MGRLRLRGRGKYWYRIYHYLCPICGSDQISKRRIYSAPKPDSEEERHEYRDAYCGCDESDKLMSDSDDPNFIEVKQDIFSEKKKKNTDDIFELSFDDREDAWEAAEISWNEKKSIFGD